MENMSAHLSMGGIYLAIAKKTIEEYKDLWCVEDPEEEPYKTKYEARKILEDALKNLEKTKEYDDEASALESKRLQVCMYRLLGQNYYWCEEVATGEKLYLVALSMALKDKDRRGDKPFHEIQMILNSIGHIWLQRGAYKESLNYLRRAQIMYEGSPSEVQKIDSIHNEYIVTQMYLAQAYNGIERHHLSAKYCTMTLSNQLKVNAAKRTEEEKKEDPFNPLEWVKNCVGISDFFVGDCMFWTAEYLLHCANAMIQRAERKEYGPMEDDMTEMKNQIKRDLGNVFLCRLKYSKALMEEPEETKKMRSNKDVKKNDGDAIFCESDSFILTFETPADRADENEAKKRLEGIIWDELFPEKVSVEEDRIDARLSEEDVGNTENPQIPKDDDGWEYYVQLGHLRVRLGVGFESFHDEVQARLCRTNRAFLESKKTYNDQGPSAAAVIFEEAREIFRLSNTYYLEALDYFKMDGWVTDHIKILQDVSQLYLTLEAFEENPVRLEKMLLRRARMLDPICDVINMTIFLNIWRIVSFECGEIYQKLFTLKMEGDEGKEDLTMEDKATVDKYNAKGILAFQTFLKSFEKDKEKPEKIDDDNLRPYVMAILYIARSYTRFLTTNKDQVIETHRLAVKLYQDIDEYAKANPEQMNKPGIELEPELKVARDMLALLPPKLDRLAKGR